MYTESRPAGAPLVQPQEKVFQDLLTQASKHLAAISDAESRLWNITHRLLNPRPQPVPGQPSVGAQDKPSTVEGQLRSIISALEGKGINLHEIASELERGI